VRVGERGGIPGDVPGGHDVVGDVEFNNARDISNNATTAISPGSPGQVAVFCGAGATNFVVDVFGYYA
jgi:hypothetical protein